MFETPIRILAAVAAAAVTLVCANAAYSIYRDYETTVIEHEVMASDLASIVADQAVRSVSDANLALVQIEEIVQAGDGLQVFNSKKEWDALLRSARRIPGGRGILIADPQGNVVANSVSPNPIAKNIADREYMKVLIENDILHVGAAIKSTLGEDEVIYTISRRIYDRHQRFVGIVSAGVTTEHLTDFYDLFGFQKNPGIVVFRDNGDIIARRPDIKDFIGKNIGSRPLFQVRLKQSSEGVFRAHSPMDGIDRINAYKRIEGMGLVVLVGIPWESATAGWLDRTWRTGAIALLSCIAIIVAAFWGGASLRRLVRAEQTLVGEQMARQHMRTFIDMATHEFKTPLTVIDSAAQMLEQLLGKERDGVDRRLTLIRKSVQRIIELIEACLAGARFEDGHPIKVTSFDPAALIQEIVERQRGHGANVLASDVSFLPAQCVADAVLLGVALDALIDNARRYGQTDVPIEVIARQDGTSIVISVCDRGPGIDEDEIERVFEKYYRGTHTRSIPGTGIGLSLVKAISDLHGGSLEYKPRDGGGAEFIFKIPLSPPNYIPEPSGIETERAGIAQPNGVAVATPSCIAGLRILLVEDDALVREITRDLLVWHGAKVTTATDGREAVAACNGGCAFDAVLMDVNIPGIDGIEATRRIRTEWGNALPIIGLSANTQAGARENALASGMTEYLTKPIEAELLGTVISACTGHAGGFAKNGDEDTMTDKTSLNTGRIEAMREIYSSDQLANYVALFERQVGTDIERILAALAARDHAAVAATAHRLAGAAANFGCVTLAAAARKLAHPQAEMGWEEMIEAVSAMVSITAQGIEGLKLALAPSPHRQQTDTRCTEQSGPVSVLAAPASSATGPR